MELRTKKIQVRKTYDTELYKVLIEKRKGLIHDHIEECELICSFNSKPLEQSFAEGLYIEAMTDFQKEMEKIEFYLNDIKSHLSAQKPKSFDLLDVENAKRVPIAEILRRNGVNVKRDKCLCPFHQERTPSFSILPTKNTWKCFGCGKGGDSITLQMELYKENFADAVKSLTF